MSAQILKVESKVDRTLNLKVNTQELAADEAGKLYDLSGKQIWLAIAETVITKEDLHIPEMVDELDSKSPSQRLRDRLYVYWKDGFDKKKITITFDPWYRKTLEKLGDLYLEKLD